MTGRDTCRSCGAAIIWANHNGKRIPMNATRVRAYELTDHPSGEPVATVMANADAEMSVRLFHVSHFVSCPNATSHSGGGRS